MIDLRDLVPGQQLEARLAVRAKRGLARYKGGYFYTLVLGDRTGELPAKVWLGPDEGAVREQYERLSVGDVVAVNARVGEYRGRLELSVEAPPEHVPPDEVDAADYLPASRRDVRALGRRLVSAARSIEDDDLRALVLTFWEDPELQRDLLEVPSGKAAHRGRLGALVEHLHGCLELVELVCRQHTELDRDLLVAGVLLHDLGKLRAYSWGASVEASLEGRLVGPGVLGDELVRQAIAALGDFPRDLAVRVRHLVLAAQGHLGPEPRTREALVLHHIEALEHEVQRALAAVREIEEAGDGEGWSRELGRVIVLG